MPANSKHRPSVLGQSVPSHSNVPGVCTASGGKSCTNAHPGTPTSTVLVVRLACAVDMVAERTFTASKLQSGRGSGCCLSHAEAFRGVHEPVYHTPCPCSILWHIQTGQSVDRLFPWPPDTHAQTTRATCTASHASTQAAASSACIQSSITQDTPPASNSKSAWSGFTLPRSPCNASDSSCCARLRPGESIDSAWTAVIEHAVREYCSFCSYTSPSTGRQRH